MDTCPIIAYLNDEPRDAAQLAGLSRLIQAHRNKAVTLATSVLTWIEILPGDMKPGAQEKLDGLLVRPAYFPVQGITKKIVMLARHLRDETKKQQRTLSTPDAIHIATAMTIQATEFHTMDGSGSTRMSRKLIPLSGTPLVESLKICLPDYVSPSEPAKDDDEGDPEDEQSSLDF